MESSISDGDFEPDGNTEGLIDGNYSESTASDGSTDLDYLSIVFQCAFRDPIHPNPFQNLSNQNPTVLRKDIEHYRAVLATSAENMSLVFEDAAEHSQSPFFSGIPLELREHCYRAFMRSLTDTNDLNKLLSGTYIEEDGGILSNLTNACKRFHNEMFELIFREYPCTFDVCRGILKRDIDFLSCVGSRIRKLCSLVALDKNNRAKESKLLKGISEIAALFEHGNRLQELILRFGGSDAAAFQDQPAHPFFLNAISLSFRVRGNVVVLTIPSRRWGSTNGVTNS